MQPELGTWERTTFWESFQFGGLEVTHAESLRELGAESDAVVTARVTAVRSSRIVQGDAAQDQVAMVCVDLRVETVIAGAAPESVCLEFVGGSPGSANALVQRALAVGLPHLPIVVFLHEKRGNGEAGLYRVTNSTGLWGATSRAALDSPLRPDPPAMSGLYDADLAGIGTVADLVRLLGQSGRART